MEKNNNNKNLHENYCNDVIEKKERKNYASSRKHCYKINKLKVKKKWF